MSTLTPKLHLNLVEDADNANTAVRVLHNQDVTILDEAVLLTAAQTLSNKTLVSPVITGSSTVTGAASATLITWTNTDPGALGVRLETVHDSASPAASDSPFMLRVSGRSSTGVMQVYGQLFHSITSPTNAAEASSWTVQTMQAGVLANAMVITGGAGQISNVASGRFGVNAATAGTINGFSFADAIPLHVKRIGVGSAYVAIDNAGAVGFMINDSSQAVDQRLWGCEINGTLLRFTSYSDAGASTTRLSVDRTGVVTMTGNLTWGATTAIRVIGDFSNATHANRVLFQTSTANGQTAVGAVPDGTGTTGLFIGYGANTPDAASYLRMGSIAGATIIDSAHTGAAATQPLEIRTDNTARARFHVSGGISLLDTTDPGAGWVRVAGAEQIVGSATGTREALRLLNSSGAVGDGSSITFYAGAAPNANARIYSYAIGANAGSLIVATANGGSFVDRVIIDTAGNVGVGAAPQAWNTNYRSLEFNGVGGILSGFTGNRLTWLFNNSYYNASGQHVPLATAAASVQIGAGNIALYADTGLTVGTAFVPTVRAQFGPGGLLLGSSSYPARGVRVTIAAGAHYFLTAGNENGLLIINNSSGLYTALFLISGWSNQVVEIADPANQFANTGTANMLCVYWDGGVGNYIIDNRYATAQTVDYWFIA